MASLLVQSIDQLSREKGIEPQIIISAVEDAILVAARKYYKSTEDLRSELNRETGQIDVYAVKKVVENVTNPTREISLEEAHKLDPNASLDSEIKIVKPTDVLGRIAAQTAKQVIFQKVREAERENVYGEYSGRIGEVINCVVKRSEGPDLIVDLGKTEGRLPRREQSKLESFQIGERIRVVIVQVEKSSKGPQVIVSRASPILVSRLFEMEVPEIYDGTVVIRSVAREAGERTKIAVFSKDRDVDCVGACVGMKGMRVQSIIRELRGEKIDIIEYNEDPVSFAANALSPAKINRVAVVDAAGKQLEVIVDDTQLSLAIGKKGQNVRLASKLLGWKIDIKSEEEKRQEVETQMEQLVAGGTPISEVAGIGERTAEKLVEQGITTVEKLGQMTPEQLQEIPGIGPKMVEKIRLAVNTYYSQFEEGAAAGEVTETAETAEAGTPAEVEEPVAVEEEVEVAPEAQAEPEQAPQAAEPATSEDEVENE
ncbi:MAG: transcription termination/antitermination protein NusA [Acidobacteria bacterium]|nr:transcription termination/antitermination protein NusA [Acidobacteriota bacterium]